MKKLLILPMILMATTAHAFTLEFDDNYLDDFCGQMLCKERLEDGEPLSKTILASEKLSLFYFEHARAYRVNKAVEAARLKAEQEA